MTAVAPETLQVPSELAAMVALYRERKPMRVLEIGVWQGGTLREWLQQGQPGAHIVSVDLEHPNWQSYSAWKPAHVGGGLCITGSSQDPDVQAKIRAEAPFSFAFIDGDHSAEGVRADVDLCLPLMAPGGVLLLHDIEPPTGMESYPPGVLFAELRDVRGFAVRRIVDAAPSDCAHGVGVVFVP